MKIQLLIIFAFFSVLANAENQNAVLDPDSVWIMEEVLSDGTLMSSDIAIYPRKDQWLLPLGEFSDSLGIAIQVSPALSLGRGFILTENRKFELDLKTCRYSISDKIESYPCNDIVVYQNDIYVTATLLAKWFPINITVNTYRAQLVVKPLEKLPMQLRREREQLANRSKGILTEFDPGYRKITPPYSLLDGPLIDEQLTINRNTDNNNVTSQFRHNTQVSGEVLGLESYAYAGGNERVIDNWRLTFSKRSNEGKVFGPFGIKQVQFADIDMPKVTLVSSGLSGKGFLFSTFPLDTPVNFESQNFQGPLQEGWEVLLYRNEVLLDRQLSDGSGRYLFKSVPLMYGKNMFRVSFFGPHGENYNEYSTFNVDPSLLRPGTFDYQFGLAFLKDSRQRLTLNYAQSLAKNLSVNAGWLQDIGAENTYALVGFTALTDLFLVTTNCAFSLYGGKACEVGEQMGIGSATLGLKYTHLFDFKSELFNTKIFTDQVSQIAANLSYAIPIHTGLMTTVEAVRKNYVFTPSDTSLVNRLALNTGRIFWNNEIIYNFDTIPSVASLTGKLNAQFYFSPVRFFLRTDYTSKAFVSYEGELQYPPTERDNISLLGKYQVDYRKTTVGARVSRIFDFMKAAVDLSYTNNSEYSAGILLAFSLYREPREGSIGMSSNPIAQSALASVQVFNDSNRNGIKDENEKAFDKMNLVVNQREGSYKTDENGISVVGPLRPHRPADFSISLDSLQDPALKPQEAGLRLIPRMGKVAKVDIPFITMGGISGNIKQKQNGTVEPMGRIQVQLFDATKKLVTTARTDREGFYSFDDLKPGKYYLKIPDTQLNGLQLNSFPNAIKATVSEEGSFEDNQDFLLSPKMIN